MSKERTRNERACSLTALLHKHELYCLHYVATVFCLRNNAACCIPLRNQRDLREKRPFTCKERARKERGYPLTALLHKHELHDSTMRQLSFVCVIMQLAAFSLRNLRDLRETWPFTCKGRTRKEQGIKQQHETRNKETKKITNISINN